VSDERDQHAGADDDEAVAQRTATYPISRLSAPIDLVNAAREIEAADTVLGAAVGSELEAIARQMRALKQQAEETLARARRDAELHRAVCRFRKRPGEVYHLYRCQDGSLYFSMLSPDDWSGTPPHPHAGSYRLEADMRWTALEDLEERDRERASIGRLLQG
jgi:hypothetical protein